MSTIRHDDATIKGGNSPPHHERNGRAGAHGTDGSSACDTVRSDLRALARRLSDEGWLERGIWDEMMRVAAGRIPADDVLAITRCEARGMQGFCPRPADSPWALPMRRPGPSEEEGQACPPAAASGPEGQQAQADAQAGPDVEDDVEGDGLDGIELPDLEEPQKSAGWRPARATIILGTDEFRVNDEATRALQKSPTIYQRANVLVQVIRQEGRKEAKGLLRPVGAPRIAPLEPATIREELTRYADFQEIKGSGEKERVEEAHPPEYCVRALAARRLWPGIRYLAAVVEAPTLRPDGSVLDKPGYDEATGLLYLPSADFPALPAELTYAAARKAAEHLLDLVHDFPFAGLEDIENDSGAVGSIHHRAAWLAGLLTLIARFAIDGPTPLNLIDGNCPGTGKTLLIDINAEIATGRSASRTACPEADEEFRKRITAIALAGDRLILLDNIAAPLGGSSLDAALTATSWDDRILGKSEMTKGIPLHLVWFASGNNVILKGDILRRVLLCRLETREERPEQRAGFKHPRLLEYVRDNRPQLVMDALTILAAHAKAGRPVPSGLKPLGSYEAWCDVVRAAVAWAVGVDPCKTREGLEASDPAHTTLAALLEGWAELPGGCTSGLTATAALAILDDPANANRYHALRNALADMAVRSDKPTARLLGYRLRTYHGRILGGRVLKGRTGHAGTQLWYVAEAGKASGGDGGDG